MLPTIIGLTGPAGAGKDTAAAYLEAAYDYRRDSFAAPLYAGLAAMLDCSVDDLQDRALKELPHFRTGVSARRMLQTLGTEWGREMIREDLWVHLALERHNQFLAMMGPDYVGTVLSDVRFANEVDAVRDRDGVVIHIDRGVAKVSSHSSENLGVWAAANYRVDNNGSVPALYKQLNTLMDRIIAADAMESPAA